MPETNPFLNEEEKRGGECVPMPRDAASSFHEVRKKKKKKKKRSTYSLAIRLVGRGSYSTQFSRRLFKGLLLQLLLSSTIICQMVVASSVLEDKTEGRQKHKEARVSGESESEVESIWWEAANRLMQSTFQNAEGSTQQQQQQQQQQKEQDWTILLESLFAGGCQSNDDNKFVGSSSKSIPLLIQQAKNGDNDDGLGESNSMEQPPATATATPTTTTTTTPTVEDGASSSSTTTAPTRHYIRHLQGLLDLSNNPDCLEREFDVSAKDFDVEEAIHVLHNCRILVLRNVLDTDTIHNKIPLFRQYIDDIHSGRISDVGTTTFGGDFYILKEDIDRFNYMLPKKLIQQASDIFANPIILDILSHPSILDDDQMILNHAGTINAFPILSDSDDDDDDDDGGGGGDAAATTGRRQQQRRRKRTKPPQYWHMDGHYVHNEYYDNDHHHAGASGGHDQPPFAINMFTPLLDLTKQHGPTEFCVGTSHLKGLDLDALEVIINDEGLLKDKSINLPLDRGKAAILQQLVDFEWEVQHPQNNDGRNKAAPPPECPSHFSRQPLLQKGDVVLFDYMVTHRGGSNISKDLRSLLFAMYSRKWYRDTTFDGGGGDDDDDCDEDDNPQQCELNYLMKLTRFAVVERVADDDDDDYDSDSDDREIDIDRPMMGYDDEL